MTESKLTLIAEQKIAEILAQLERDTGTIIEEISIVDVDATQIQDTRTQLLRRVVIELRPMPGTRWEA